MGADVISDIGPQESGEGIRVPETAWACAGVCGDGEALY